MKRLWAPWRKKYIRPNSKPQKGCLFCRLKTSKQDAQNYVLKRNPTCYAVLNLFPYNNGHILIVPNRHVDSPSKLKDTEKLDWLRLHDEILGALERVVKPHGFNVGINLGRAAGAGIPKHLHLHIVPRWKGDSNFMPVLSGTKVISESLDSLYSLMKKELARRVK